LDEVWREYSQKIDEGALTPPDDPASEKDSLPGRTLNPHHHVEGFQGIMADAALLKICQMLLGTAVIPFQSIASHKGSQQKLHSDAIHMTTDPLGGLVAAWVAFEDINENSGPLEFCPGSHKLPYLLSDEVGITNEDFEKEGYMKYHQKYEPRIDEEVETNSLARKTFLAKKGDVLIWHHNLVHGGSRRNDVSLSRKALVTHYFSDRVHCYHDLSGGVANIDKAKSIFGK